VQYVFIMQAISTMPCFFAIYLAKRREDPGLPVNHSDEGYLGCHWSARCERV